MEVTLSADSKTPPDLNFAPNATPPVPPSSRGARPGLGGRLDYLTGAERRDTDAEWPYTDKANAGVRREFFLPVDRPFNVKAAQGTPPPVIT